MKKLLLLILFTGNWLFMKGQGGPDPASMLKSIETANDSLKPRMYSRIGFYYYSRDQFDSALYYVNLSLSVSRKLNLKNEIGNAYNNLGSLYRLRSDFSTAFGFFQKALDAYEEAGDELGSAKVYANMAAAYGDQMQPRKSIEMNLHARLRFQRQNDTISMISCYINLINAHSQLNESNQGRKYLDSARRLYTAKNNSTALTPQESEQLAFASLFLDRRQALQLHNEKKYDSSILLFKQIAGKLAGQGALAQVDVFKGLSENYIQTKQYDSALHYMNTALALLKEDSVAEGYKDTYMILSQIHEEQGRYKEALEAFKLYKSFDDSITNSKNYRALASLNTIHETKQKDEKIAQLDRERKAQNVIILLTIAGAIIALGLMIFAFRSRKLQQSVFRQKEELLRKEKEIENNQLRTRMSELEQMALRAQMNPHFIFNSLNSVQHYVMKSDMEGVNKYLGIFAHLVRQTLNNSGKQLISLDEEIKYLETYLSLEKMKSNDQFDYQIKVDDQVDRFATLIPGMILQPFVENSIKHGIVGKKNDGKINMHFSRNGKLSCRIEDNGVGRVQAAEYKKLSAAPGYESKGMDITFQRIETINRIFNSSITVTIDDKADSSGMPAGTRVEILFPVDLE